MDDIPLYMLRAIAALFLIAVNASVAGTFTVFRNVSFLVAGASHAALAGAALAIVLETYNIFSMNPIVGGILFAMFTAIAAGYASKDEGINTAIGISFALSMSLAVLFISMIREYAARVWGLLIGDLFLLTNEDLVLMLISTLLVVFVCSLLYREFLFISFDMEGAMAYGINASMLNYVLLSLIAVAVVVTLKGVGAILVFAMFVAPAAAAVEVAGNVRQVFILAFLIAMVSGFVGLAISFFYQVSPGAVASLFASLTYFAAVAYRR
ncbi:metal ABC transporter permease [Archaeoglobus veneficus]|uniref:ABC-type transporter, integral membrane subunit n=1 Tax=Archaeoglobus veneficus (strain DSM 11195 / SNP6) TaxID=693661 RepID=F2KMY7_ARCVS|nr:metal ABC transporter permease [Archaeoglobus veneficus]AEA47263.1 ABC-type transporter, integral membrane subunit [Archaeoglobus veneficus SNP6]